MIKTKFLTILIVIILTFNSHAAFELKANRVVNKNIKNFILIIFNNFNVFKF